ncbi:hypothetical protein QE449_003347 [Rhodococcus sp. SORGH_AS303]|nr:hypothetical protein [Rhodococcus sp. SORGH_AS_0303]
MCAHQRGGAHPYRASISRAPTAAPCAPVTRGAHTRTRPARRSAHRFREAHTRCGLLGGVCAHQRGCAHPYRALHRSAHPPQPRALITRVRTREPDPYSEPHTDSVRRTPAAACREGCTPTRNGVHALPIPFRHNNSTRQSVHSTHPTRCETAVTATDRLYWVTLLRHCARRTSWNQHEFFLRRSELPTGSLAILRSATGVLRCPKGTRTLHDFFLLRRPRRQ